MAVTLTTAGNVDTYTVTFEGNLAGQDVSQLVATPTTVTAGGQPQ